MTSISRTAGATTLWRAGIDRVRVFEVDLPPTQASPAFAGAGRTLVTVRHSGEPYTFGFDPPELPRYVAERGLALIEGVSAAEYRARYLAPSGRGHEPLSEFQRAALVEVCAPKASG